MRVLGVSCDYHDAAAALLVDGEVVAACEEERFSRVKHDDALPTRAIASCLAIGEIGPDDVDVVVVHEKPLAVTSRVLAVRQRQGPRGIRSFADEMPQLLRRNLFVGYRVEQAFAALGGTRRPELRYGEHHLSHAAAAFLASPYPSAAVLTIDGIGEWATASIGHGVKHRIELVEEQRYPNSLGLLYSLVTSWCGFEPNDGEYKVMGLAPYGEPTFRDALGELVDVGPNGELHVDARALGWWSPRGRTRARLADLLGGPPLAGGQPVGRREADLARSMQDLAEEVVAKMAAHAVELTGERQLCLAGGVALNCVANGKLLRSGVVDDLWVQPAAGDAGSALGAALWYWHDELGRPREREAVVVGTLPADAMAGGQLGPAFGADEVAAWLDAEGIPFERLADVTERCDRVASRLAEGAVVGWFEGRMEFGPRALGHRSILADPRDPGVQRDLNLRVKGRESFRPFAPAVLWEHAAEWFDLDRPAPYMWTTADVAADKLLPVDVEPEDLVARVQVPRSQIPACTHIDGSARVQTVHLETNPTFHLLLERFHERTGCPVLVNTSFNRAGEPIVCTPSDALASAQVASLDLLVLEDCLIEVAALAAAPATEAVEATS